MTNDLTNLFAIEQINGLTCNSCQYRQRHQCNSKVFQYCGKRKSNRTTNGLLKIKCKRLPVRFISLFYNTDIYATTNTYNNR